MYGLKIPAITAACPWIRAGARVVDTGLKFSLPVALDALADPRRPWHARRHPRGAAGQPVRDAAIFAGGVINTVLISGIVAWRRPEPLYLSWLILELALAAVRVMVLRSALRAARHGGNTDVYILLALLWAFSVGYGVFVTFLNGDWLSATLAGVSCGAMAGGICFRNYGAPRLVAAMIFLSLGPMCLGRCSPARRSPPSSSSRSRSTWSA